MKRFLDDFTEEELSYFAANAYADNYDTPKSAPVKLLNDKTSVLELWHGPTCAFKDMALQILPYLLTASLKKTGEQRKVCILVATSGDTGKAALEGFKDVPDTKISVYFPADGVSDMQALQMRTQEGGNVSVHSVVGNFDDVQSTVKKIFSDKGYAEELSGKGWFLSSANSINWGRLLPQIVYYVSAYCDMLNEGKIKLGEKLNFCVPTGNFGDILAGYYARKMGLPVSRLICASNANNVLTDFIMTGEYDKNRSFYTTVSPSMDILISSNLERLLYDVSGHNDKLVAEYMNKLSAEGKYTVTDEILTAVTDVFSGGFATEEETAQAIRSAFDEYGYLIDTHTAVAYSVYGKYRAETADDTPCVIVSTASPFKFGRAVLGALGETLPEDDFEMLSALSAKTGVSVPAPLAGLKTKTVRFNETVTKETMQDTVSEFLM